jgi:chromosome segregation ATPase
MAQSKQSQELAVAKGKATKLEKQVAALAHDKADLESEIRSLVSELKQAKLKQAKAEMELRNVEMCNEIVRGGLSKLRSMTDALICASE